MKPPKVATNQRGSALIATIVYLSTLTALAAAFLTLFHQTMAHWHDGERHQICLHIAEGGLEKAIAELQTDRAGYRGEEGTPLGMGRFSVAIEPGPRPGAYHIVSTAKVGAGNLVRAKARTSADITLATDGRVRTLDWIEVKRW